MSTNELPNEILQWHKHPPTTLTSLRTFSGTDDQFNLNRYGSQQPTKRVKTNRDKEGTNGNSSNNTRAGALNYSTDYITALLDIVGDVEPLGGNHWTIVAKIFTAWATAQERPLWDQDSQKVDFHKIANTKKNTGDPSRANHIAR